MKPTLDEVFAILEQFARRRDRCPENGCHGVGWGNIPALAREGRIRIEISGQNFRRIHILTGPNAGYATAPDPNGRPAWKVVNKSGTRINGRLVLPPRRKPQPIRLARF